MPKTLMNSLSPLMPAAHIVLGASAQSKKRLFEAIGFLIENEYQIPALAVYDCLMARERVGTTGLGFGVAVPHGRLNGLTQPLAVFVQLSQAIAFDALDHQSVDLVVALLMPEHNTQMHLARLSELAEILGNPAHRHALRDACDMATVQGVFASV